jgi:lactoylglutathione lyase
MTTASRLLHTMLRVVDLDASKRFYCDVLGMRVLRERDYPDGKFTLCFLGYGDEASHTVIELTFNWEKTESSSYEHGGALREGACRWLKGDARTGRHEVQGARAG